MISFIYCPWSQRSPKQESIHPFQSWHSGPVGDVCISLGGGGTPAGNCNTFSNDWQPEQTPAVAGDVGSTGSSERILPWPYWKREGSRRENRTVLNPANYKQKPSGRTSFFPAHWCFLWRVALCSASNPKCDRWSMTCTVTEKNCWLSEYQQPIQQRCLLTSKWQYNLSYW